MYTMVGKVGKVWSLPRFWVTLRSYNKQPVKKCGLEYWLDLAWLKFAVAALDIQCIKKKKRHLRIKWSLKRGHEYFLRVCPSGKKSYFFSMYVSLELDIFTDFLITLGIKPRMHLLEISIFSQNDVIIRPTKIINRGDKNWAHF